MIQRLIKNQNPYLLISALIILIYFRSLFFGFTYFDDNVLILDNLAFIQNLGNLFKAFQLEVFHVLHSSAAYYRPILTISFMFDAQFSGQNPFFYHFTNILIHLISSCLIYLLFTKLNYKKDLALFGALIFAVHPVLTQAVSWVPGRNDSLLTLFLLSSFIFLINYFETNKNTFLFFHLIFFALGIFTKESTVFYPALLVYYLIIIKKTNLFSEKLIYLGISWLTIIFVWFVMRSQALVNPVGYTPEKTILTILKNSPAVLLYLGKVFFPVNLSVLPTLQDSTLIFGAISGLVLTLLILISYKNYKLIIFGIGWFLIFLLPSFVRPNDFYTADFIEHRVYLPLIGLLIILFEVNPIKKINLNKNIYFYPSAILVIALSIYTFIYSNNFSNSLVFWQNAVKHSPHHPLAHKNLGAMYYLNGNPGEAEKYYRQALILSPIETMVHNNLAVIYMDKEEYQRALSELDEEIKINPLYDRAFFNYGLIYYKLGDLKKAQEYWLKTLEINPDHPGALYNLAILEKKN